MNIALNSGWSLWALIVEIFCLNTSKMRYFHQSWSPCPAFAASGEPARRVNGASGGAGGRSPPPKVDIWFKSGKWLAKRVYFPLLALKEPLRSISSAPRQLRSTLTCKSNLPQLQFGTALCKVCGAAQFSTIREILHVRFLSVLHTSSSLGEAEGLILPKNVLVLPESPTSFCPLVMLCVHPSRGNNRAGGHEIFYWDTVSSDQNSAWDSSPTWFVCSFKVHSDPKHPVIPYPSSACICPLIKLRFL